MKILKIVEMVWACVWGVGCVALVKIVKIDLLVVEMWAAYPP